MIKKNVFLIGPRACGKTSVGRALADKLGIDFVDTDHELVASVGMEIAEYVEQNGWDGFRDKETETLGRVVSEGVRVVGCGGGIVLREANREMLKEGVTLYLKTDPEVLAERLMRDPNEAQRPSLTGKSIVDEVREILAERAPLYEGYADAVLPEGELKMVVEAAIKEVELLS
ncbi:shikimate kinase AroL [Pseudodesulfovibrio sp. zrk46]|uniref:shikimate kinase AroL n=1 Tax=Pseudodesulfovibrio sp. zrk46 TaxID=2725288 RepID=UPI00144A2A4A|nr:shikimate kinase AroL [Pseudodesulfovibrio sp. zrk46]QJB54888.1 shikimate kinase AroL [Pseudodesulfovibrio sp. zrk46]